MNGLIWNNIHLVIARVVFVDFARLHRGAVPLRDRYLRTLEIMTATLWPAFCWPWRLRTSLHHDGLWREVVAGGFAAPDLLATASMIKVGISMTWEVFAVMGELGLKHDRVSPHGPVAPHISRGMHDQHRCGRGRFRGRRDPGVRSLQSTPQPDDENLDGRLSADLCQERTTYASRDHSGCPHDDLVPHVGRYSGFARTWRRPCRCFSLDMRPSHSRPPDRGGNARHPASFI